MGFFVTLLLYALLCGVSVFISYLASLLGAEVHYTDILTCIVAYMFCGLLVRIAEHEKR